ncbi:MAG: nucleotide exchange factor GrpE [Syntrophobacteria bacterium]
MDPKEQREAKREEEEEQLELNAGQQEAAPEEEQTASDEAEDKEQPFDPETADRDSLLAQYRELETKLSEAQERVLRVAADAENFKKRLEREKQEQTRYANESFIRDLLPVIDNLERALDHSQGVSDEKSLVEGLNMTLRGFMDTLARFGCTPVEAAGKEFDPKLHEAVAQEETTEQQANVVVRELQKGYMLKDRLLRPAMVVVSTAPSGSRDQEEKQVNEGKEAATNQKIKVNPA